MTGGSNTFVRAVNYRGQLVPIDACQSNTRLLVRNGSGDMKSSVGLYVSGDMEIGERFPFGQAFFRIEKDHSHVLPHSAVAVRMEGKTPGNTQRVSYHMSARVFTHEGKGCKFASTKKAVASQRAEYPS